MFTSLKQAIDELGEARALRYINAHRKNVEYRKERQNRIKADQKEAKILLERVRKDPRFADLMKTKKTA